MTRNYYHIVHYQHEHYPTSSELVSIDELAENIMNTPVTSCSSEELLSEAIKQMLLNDIQRIFVYGDDTKHIKGVLSLSDAARFRSGTCRACVASRILEAI